MTCMLYRNKLTKVIKNRQVYRRGHKEQKVEMFISVSNKSTTQKKITPNKGFFISAKYLQNLRI